MAQPVWVLSVDLQAKTATFQTGLADAAKAARGSFTDIKSGSGEMGEAINYEMGEARHSVMMLGEEFGVHLPRSLTSFIAGLGPIGPALEAAFPFLAIILGATLLIEHLTKMHEAGEKLTDDQVKFGTAVNNAFNSLDQKILQAQIKSDELRNDHLGALHHQLELIDKQSMAELVHSFDEVAKAADVVMKDLEGHWYNVGKGSAGASHALQQFQTEYSSLMSQGKEGEAHDLLAGTLKSAQSVLDFQKQYKANQTDATGGNGKRGDYVKFEQAALALKQIGVGVTEKEVEAQETLVAALGAQVQIEGKVNDLKKLDKGNDTKTVGNEGAAQAAAAARAAAESRLRMNDQAIAADRAGAEAILTTHRASLETRLAVEIAFAERERDAKLQANAAEIAGLDKSGKDYQNQLKSLNDKNLEIGVEFNTKAAELKAKASVDAYNRDLRDLEQNEREKIEATEKGTAARIAAIDAGIKDEESRNLQDTNFFRELLNQRVEAIQQEAAEEGKQKAEQARESADNDEKMGALSIAAEKARMALADSARRTTAAQRIADDTKVANEEYAVKQKALEKEIQGLDKGGKDYETKLKALQDKEKQATQAHENELTDIKEKAEEERNRRILSAESTMESTLASGLTKSIMGHQTWARMVTSFGDEAVAGMIKNSLMIMMQQDKERLGDAKKAATSAYATGEKIGGPAGLILGPVFAAAAFAGVMAFNSGTDSVPGLGNRDSVPTMLTPGEGVVPGGVMDGLRNMARNGGFNQQPQHNVQIHMTNHVNTIDGDGMEDALSKHAKQVQSHVENAVRRLNK